MQKLTPSERTYAASCEAVTLWDAGMRLSGLFNQLLERGSTMTPQLATEINAALQHFVGCDPKKAAWYKMDIENGNTAANARRMRRWREKKRLELIENTNDNWSPMDCWQAWATVGGPDPLFEEHKDAIVEEFNKCLIKGADAMRPIMLRYVRRENLK